jgi:hypothetical protein
VLAQHLNQIVGSIFCHVDDRRSAGARTGRCRYYLYRNLSTDFPKTPVDRAGPSGPARRTGAGEALWIRMRNGTRHAAKIVMFWRVASQPAGVGGRVVFPASDDGLGVTPNSSNARLHNRAGSFSPS